MIHLGGLGWMYVLIFRGGRLAFEGSEEDTEAASGFASCIDDWETALHEDEDDCGQDNFAVVAERGARLDWVSGQLASYDVFVTAERPYLWIAWGSGAEVRNVSVFSSEEHMMSTAPVRDPETRQPISGATRRQFYRSLIRGDDHSHRGILCAGGVCCARPLAAASPSS
jgi:hypothetical protein